jgi:Luciferase-like monooxygenase
MRQLGRLGVWYPIDRLEAAGIKRLLRTIENLGYSTFWYPEALGYESLSIASFMLANTERLIVGSSIANIYARDPFTARRGLRTLSGLYDDRFILGLGVSHPPMVEKLRGHVYDKPVPTTRRYLDGLYEDPSNTTEWPVAIAALGPLVLKLSPNHHAALQLLELPAGIDQPGFDAGRSHQRRKRHFACARAAPELAQGQPSRLHNVLRLPRRQPPRSR